MTKFALLALTALFLINIYTGVLEGWGNNYWLSAAFHFLGGFFVAELIYSYYHNHFRSLPQYLQILVVVAMTMGVGVLWEFVEFSAYKTLTERIYHAYQYRVYFMGDLTDTIFDLLMDTLGSIAFLSLSLFFQKGSRR